jgi:hypothetical protein
MTRNIIENRNKLRQNSEKYLFETLGGMRTGWLKRRQNTMCENKFKNTGEVGGGGGLCHMSDAGLWLPSGQKVHVCACVLLFM